MAKKIRVYELARELGLTNKEALDLCTDLGIGVKSHSSSIEDAQADRARRKADQLGIRREVQPEEVVPTPPGRRTTPVEPTPVGSAPATPAPAAAKTADASPAARPTEPAPAPTPAEPAPAPALPGRNMDDHRLVTSKPASEQPEYIRPAPRPAPAPPVRPAAAPMRPAAAAAPPAAPAAPPTVPGDAPLPASSPQDAPAAGPSTPPISRSGKPIPPPPGGPPMSASGKPIPPPPGAGGRPAPAGGPRPGGFGAGRPAGPGGPGRPAPGGPRPGGFGVNRPPSTGAGAGGGGGGGGFRGGPGGGPRGGPGPGMSGGTGPSGRGGPGGRGGRPPQRRRRRRRNIEELEQPNFYSAYVASDAPVPEGEIIIERGSSAKDLGPKLNRSAADVVRFLLQQGEMVTATQSLSEDAIELFAAELGAVIKLVDPGEEKEAELQARYFDDEEEEDPDTLRPRPPVITVMGHVDHGKTLLLDRIRETNVIAGEAGGITQHIGAYQVEKEGRLITFIDTPGHEAFTAMRARGAEVTDIVVLVVAADDGVMPQTIEAINHAKSADVPIVVAVNKVDREDADPNRVMQQLSDHGLVPEEWGGDTIMVQVSALQNLGVDDILEQLLLVADVEELVANPEGRARGAVLEANLDTGRGPVATVIVESGTLRVGDPIVAGAAWGRVRALIDDKGDNVKEAHPSMPVQVLGFSDVPNAGDEFRVTGDDRTARTIGETRGHRYRTADLRRVPSLPGAATGAKLEDIFEQIQRGEVATLNLILKADVQGSLEALTESLKKLERDEVKLAFVHRAVGGITENDVQLAAASNATIIGFNVRPDRKGREMAEEANVDIRTYEIIYKVLEEIESAMVGMLEPEYEEIVTGDAEVLKVFGIPRIGKIAGCAVRNGVITRGSKVRFLREGVVIWNGTITSLKREKDDAREVRQGFECGIGLSDFQDLKEGDVIETYEDREIPRT
ncbi:MAG TPA: translation initiation factor IF-2 [Acidimicrobiales bacterium]|nr:translation initiation factor IF-2 [Acidimicrobiales bacterium]